MWNVVGEDGDVHQKFSKPEGPDVLPPHLNYHPDHPSVSFSYDHKLNPAVVSNSVVALNPTLRSCVQNFGKFEFGCIAITTIAGAVTSFRNKRRVLLHHYPF
jgi:hypothetical protein